MKKLTRIFLTVFVAVAAQVGGAASFTSPNLMLVFRDGVNSDVEFDLGTVSNYLNLAPGTVVPVSYDSGLVSSNFSGLGGVKFAVVGVDALTDPRSRVWLSDADLVSVPSDLTGSTWSTLASKVDGVRTSAKAQLNGAAGPLVIDPADQHSYSYIVSGGDSGSVSTMGGDAPFTVESTNPPASVALYELVPSAASPQPAAIKVGTFALDGSGNLTFTASAVTPVITSPALANKTIPVNGANTFSITADGGSQYQWYLNGFAIAGATNSSYSVSGAYLGQGGNYTVVVGNPAYGTSATSSSVTLSVVGAPVIVTPPANQIVSLGGTASFGVYATNAYTGLPNTFLQYQWYKNSSLISGAIEPSLTITNVQPSDVTSYYVVVSNLGGNTQSSSANIALASALVPAQNVVISRSNYVTTISFVSTNGNNYQLLSTTTLPPVWQTNVAAGVVAGDNTVKTFTDNNTNKSQFYRIQSF